MPREEFDLLIGGTFRSSYYYESEAVEAWEEAIAAEQAPGTFVEIEHHPYGDVRCGIVRSYRVPKPSDTGELNAIFAGICPVPHFPEIKAAS